MKTYPCMPPVPISHTKDEVINMEEKDNTKNLNLAADEYDIDIQSCSTMDCTGLIPSLPQSDAEVEHYNQLYRFLPTEVPRTDNK